MQESNQKSNQKILAAMQRDPSVTIKGLQDITGLSLQPDGDDRK